MSEARWQNENILQASYVTGWSVLRNTVDYYKKIATVNHNFFFPLPVSFVSIRISCLYCMLHGKVDIHKHVMVK